MSNPRLQRFSPVFLIKFLIMFIIYFVLILIFWLKFLDLFCFVFAFFVCVYLCMYENKIVPTSFPEKMILSPLTYVCTLIKISSVSLHCAPIFPSRQFSLCPSHSTRCPGKLTSTKWINCSPLSSAFWLAWGDGRNKQKSKMREERWISVFILSLLFAGPQVHSSCISPAKLDSSCLPYHHYWRTGSLSLWVLIIAPFTCTLSLELLMAIVATAWTFALSYFLLILAMLLQIAFKISSVVPLCMPSGFCRPPD